MPAAFLIGTYPASERHRCGLRDFNHHTQVRSPDQPKVREGDLH